MLGPISTADALTSACDAIREVYRAFGPPGEHGYETPEGKALFALYKAEAVLRTHLDLYRAAQRRAGGGR